jgi:hypothetical protein
LLIAPRAGKVADRGARPGCALGGPRNDVGVPGELPDAGRRAAGSTLRQLLHRAEHPLAQLADAGAMSEDTERRQRAATARRARTQRIRAVRLRVATIAATLFLAAWTGIFVQLVSGRDPALAKDLAPVATRSADPQPTADDWSAGGSTESTGAAGTSATDAGASATDAAAAATGASATATGQTTAGSDASTTRRAPATVTTAQS